MACEGGFRVAETEIHVVAVSRQMKEYLIGECKFKGKPFRYSEYLDMLEKLIPQKQGEAFYYALFSESEFDEKICAEAEREGNIYFRWRTL